MFKKNSRGEILTADGHDVTQYVVEEHTSSMRGEPLRITLVFWGAEEGVFHQFGDATGIQTYGFSRPKMVKIRNSLDMRTMDDVNLASYCEDVRLEYVENHPSEHPMYKVVVSAFLAWEATSDNVNTYLLHDLEVFHGVQMAQAHSDMVDAIAGAMGIPESMMNPQPVERKQDPMPRSEEAEYRAFRGFVDSVPVEHMMEDDGDVLY